MECRQHFDCGNARIVLQLAAHLRDADFSVEQGLNRGIAQRHDQLWANRLDLAKEKRDARLDLVRFGRAVARRARFDHIGDVNVFALQVNRFDHFGEQLPVASSSAPGPSPTNINSALGLPSPKTMFVRVEASLQRRQSPRSRRMSSRVSSACTVSVNEGAASPKSDGSPKSGATAEFSGLVGIVIVGSGAPCGSGMIVGASGSGRFGSGAAGADVSPIFAKP